MRKDVSSLQQSVQLKTTNASYVAPQSKGLKYNIRNLFYQISYLKSCIPKHPYGFQLVRKE